MVNFWIFVFVIFLISLPFILIFYFSKNVGAATNTLNSLYNAKDYLDTVQRVLKICMHVAGQSKVALEDLKFVQKNCKDLKEMMVVNTVEKGKIETLDEPEERICRIFIEGRLTKLSEDFLKIANKCQEVSAKYGTKKQDIPFFKQFERMSDEEIVKWFVPEQDLEWCNDLAFVKRYIETEGKNNL